jgi:hypothetical protein
MSPVYDDRVHINSPADAHQPEPLDRMPASPVDGMPISILTGKNQKSSVALMPDVLQACRSLRDSSSVVSAEKDDH